MAGEARPGLQQVPPHAVVGGTSTRPENPMLLVVILTVRPEALDAFRAFERQAARIMARHGGRIERAIVIPPGPPGPSFKEVHLVSFPSPEALAAYRADPALQALTPLRETAVLNTEIWVGEEGPQYGNA